MNETAAPNAAELATQLSASTGIATTEELAVRRDAPITAMLRAAAPHR